jgi:5-methylcytosine-specific restriction endonuclease McrA
MDAETRRLVRERAGDRCEYCQLPQQQSPLASLQVEHIRPKKHQGSDSLENLALACIDCNLHKGTNIAGFDPDTDKLTPLFDPRHDSWSQHFAWAGVLLVGLTPTARATIAVLDLNSPDRLELRSLAGR